MSKPPSPWQNTPPLAERSLAAIARLSSVLRAARWQAAGAEGLNPAQADALELLASRPEGMRLKALAEQLAVSAASASDTVSALVAKGLVEKRADARDGRALALHLTRGGRASLRRVGKGGGFMLDALGALPDSQAEALYAALLALIGGLQRDARFPPLRCCLSCRHFQPARHADPAAPHHCALVDAPLSPALLRVDCAEHEEAGAAVLSARLSALV